MLIVDCKKSEIGQQRKRAGSSLLHCCCICGILDVWGDSWCGFYSLKQLDDGNAIPKFCSPKCAKKAGKRAENVTEEMLARASAAEWREPMLVYRDATEREKYNKAVTRQKDRRNDILGE